MAILPSAFEPPEPRDSGLRRRAQPRPQAEDAVTIPVRARGAATVFVVTRDEAAYRTIACELGPLVPVVRAQGVAPAVAAFRIPELDPLVVLDFRRDYDEAAVAQIARSVPANGMVVVWGGPRSTPDAPLPAGAQWLTFDMEADPDDVAAMVGVLVGSVRPP